MERSELMESRSGSQISSTSGSSSLLQEGRNSMGSNAYNLHVHVLKGQDLVARDSSGSSDPYVKMKMKDKTLFKTRKVMQNLCPVWDEHFECIVEDLSSALHFEVFDFDRIGRDEYMGAAKVSLLDQDDKQVHELKLLLKDDPADKYLGYILVNVSLKPMTKEERAQLQSPKQKISKDVPVDRSMSLKRFSKGHNAPEFLVNVVLAEGRNLVPPGHAKSTKHIPNPYVKLKLGPTKVKSKVVSKTYDPKWLEQYELRSYCLPDQQLEVDVIDKHTDDMIGRFTVDLSKLPKSVTSQRWYPLDNGSGEILMLITISPMRSLSMDEESFQNKSSEEIAAMAKKYKLLSTFKDVPDVGFLVVKAYKAQGLAAADIGSKPMTLASWRQELWNGRKSDPYCVLELVNCRAQTSTVYKTLDPEWNQYFTFAVKDINSVLEVTVYDEDQKSDSEFLGKVGIPLLKIRDGQKRWYALKNKNLRKRTKGHVLLEMKLMWNPVRAAARSFAPKEHKYMAHTDSFKRQVLVKNVNRVKGYILMLRDTWAYVQSCFNWESPQRSIIAFMIFLLVTYYWGTYMIPLFILLLFAWSYLLKRGIVGLKEGSPWHQEDYIESSEDEDASPNGNDQNTSITEKIRGIQDKLLEVQNALDAAASTMERIRNVFTFSQPFLSCVAIAVATVATILLYLIPLRYIIMAWGINKFTKRLRKKRGYRPSNEVLNYLSRVFSDKEERMYGEFYVKQQPGGSP